MQPRRKRQTPGGASPAPGSVPEPFKGERPAQSRGENTPKGGRISAHSVFVLSIDGKPLTPTTPCHARKLLRCGAATKCWSKFGIFGIQLTTSVGAEQPTTAIGIDHGTKFEGYSVVIGTENPLNVKLDLPDKKVLCRKLEERRTLRRARRFRNCRRRPARFNNRRRGPDWLAPSQAVIVGSRLKVISEVMRIYPIQDVALENVRFAHNSKPWGANFSTVEIGKAKVRGFLEGHGATVFTFQGHETKAIREGYGYRKTSDKSADKFEAHCSDSLALAVEVTTGRAIEPGPFLVVDDTYRPKRRRLHDTQPAKGGIRERYSRGTVFGLRKGLLIGLRNGKAGRLCGEYKGGFRYYEVSGKRCSAKRLMWVSSNFFCRCFGLRPNRHPSVA